tara:strand:- start:2864 stop:3328 length:465 start_codon:yes stop_codon:yes gene_type:complete
MQDELIQNLTNSSNPPGMLVDPGAPCEPGGPSCDPDAYPGSVEYRPSMHREHVGTYLSDGDDYGQSRYGMGELLHTADFSGYRPGIFGGFGRTGQSIFEGQWGNTPSGGGNEVLLNPLYGSPGGAGDATNVVTFEDWASAGTEPGVGSDEDYLS